MRWVIDQTERRVLRREKVTSREKTHSIFEEHTDIVKKGQREPTIGHKAFPSVGKSSLILDCRAEPGNPARSRASVADGPHAVWACDFAHDVCSNGQKLKILTVVDEYTRQALAIDVAGRVDSPRVVDVPDY